MLKNSYLCGISFGAAVTCVLLPKYHFPNFGESGVALMAGAFVVFGFAFGFRAMHDIFKPRDPTRPDSRQGP